MKSFGGLTLLTIDEARSMGIEPPKSLPVRHCEYCGEKLDYKVMTFGGEIPPSFFLTKCCCPESIEVAEVAEKKKIREMFMEGVKRQKKELLANHDDGIKARYRRRDFDSFVAESPRLKRAKDLTVRYTKAFTRIQHTEKNSLFIHGGCGCGKTHLSIAIANALRDEGVRCIFITFEELLLRIRDTYDKNDLSDKVVRDRCKWADLLIIDDLAKEKATEFSTSVLFDLINYRYENLLPIIVTANHGKDELIGRLTPNDGDQTKAEAIVSRFNEMCTDIDMSGIEDWRR